MIYKVKLVIFMILKEKILREQSELKLCRNEDREKKGERESKKDYRYA